MVGQLDMKESESPSPLASIHYSLGHLQMQVFWSLQLKLFYFVKLNPESMQMQRIRRIRRDLVQPWSPEAEIPTDRTPSIKKYLSNLFLKSSNEWDPPYVIHLGTLMKYSFYCENIQYKLFSFPLQMRGATLFVIGFYTVKPVISALSLF